ncbi:hypothetical protein A3H85_02550 [Candidatus Daviesbacteria bacterium RIFCSPLOWO2_02_FULL_40_8]|uniref:EfeO-type cupredoxin-like domain-containing protein n=1 Tax=Candidatus Daviesbacteria bacterium RIFCSPLOWO2_01_FULL_40_24 TaxID=1797787 RepID=A0A1F5MIG0_9BACT|nr:MAG: hypothetical protein A2780_03280 [Candidatus Daviesbacteria bacterium RIFCSPHIGHO2_01_FULL_41_45]OGE34170.1 MAG: hypothetical protein A3C32_00365 [Candidatus Daviesbacteria bacterium RIFCSPHIGHO2_02_FULL_41_14]OGE65154.1 MAG: hypothetical protein A3B49_01315 [Candidatus Daviesbacteria bacterium RIFCSPLOWO2_01_FULL_40_24]OGE66857.1 MAG: hypothetical protein A3H85_02550 [Candidatus Daviesbacteria bacterium RIFCSPLOWO2_02_FULL_40_8]
MSIDKILVLISGFFGVGFIYWFFLMRKENIVDVKGEVEITVSGGYSPQVISLSKGKLTKISFKRTDASSCLEEVIIPDFKIKKFLPLNQIITVEIIPQKTGEFRYSCGMNMYHGKIIVRD